MFRGAVFFQTRCIYNMLHKQQLIICDSQKRKVLLVTGLLIKQHYCKCADLLRLAMYQTSILKNPTNQIWPDLHPQTHPQIWLNLGKNYHTYIIIYSFFLQSKLNNTTLT